LDEFWAIHLGKFDAEVASEPWNDGNCKDNYPKKKKKKEAYFSSVNYNIILYIIHPESMDGRRQASNESGSVNSVNQEFRWAHNVEWLVKRGDFSAIFKWEMSEYISEEVKMDP